MDSCESGFVIYILLEGVALKRVHFRFGMEGVWWELGENYQVYEVYLANVALETFEVYISTLTFISVDVIYHSDRACGRFSFSFRLFALINVDCWLGLHEVVFYKNGLKCI